MRLRGSHRSAMISEISRGTGVPKGRVRAVLALFLACVRDTTWQEGEVRLPEFGTFRVKHAKARRIANPPGQPAGVTQLAQSQVVRFTPSKNWRRR